MLKGLVGALEAKLVFFPYRGEDQTPAALGIPYHSITLTTTDGERIVGWQLEPAKPIADVVYFHGNGGNLSVWLPVFASLYERGLRVFAIDYRGYGLSTGSPSEQGVYRDAEAAARHAAGNRPSGIPLVFWGRSLGGPIAASATRVVQPDGLILESAFVDKAAVIRSQPVLRALNLFGAYRFETAEMLQSFSRPILVIHGDRDSIIPYELGRELFDRLDGPKQFVRVQDGDHNDFFDTAREAYWKPVLSFLTDLPRR